jgi:glycosyltransferase involved in cell wall biosynthesis
MPQEADFHSLVGKRIGFYTSVIGMGGSEVLVADAMEAAYQAGAKIICWSGNDAAIRKIASLRADKLEVEFRDWPINAPSGHIQQHATANSINSRRRFSSRRFIRNLLPFWLKRWLGFYRTARAFVSEIEADQLDLLFVNVNGSEAVSVAGKMSDICLVNCYHLSFTASKGSFFERYADRSVRHATMKSSSKVVHTSFAVRDEWCTQFQYPLSKCRVIYNGVDPIEVDPRETMRVTLQLSQNQIVFCVPGRFDHIKGHTVLIDAVSHFKSQLSSCIFLFCGEGGIEEELRNRINKTETSEFFRFLGWRADLPSVLHASDFAILPSIASENLSVAILEGLMCGTPAIVTRVGGMAEAVLDGITGYVVEPGNAEQLGNLIATIAHEPFPLHEMRIRAKSDASHRFSRSRMMGQYVELFSDLIQ